MFIQQAPAAIFAYTIMKTLFTSATTVNQTLMALIYMPLKSNLSQDYATGIPFNDISFKNVT